MQLKTINLLLIEDDPGDMKLVSEMLNELETSRFHLHHAVSLNEGLDYLKENTFDLILLDIHLPDSNGLETLKRLHENVSNKPVIILTGIDDDTLGIKLMQIGAQDYLVKSDINPQILYRSIRYALERHSLRQKLEEERQRNAYETEIHSLEKIMGFQIPQATAQLLGQALLSKSVPEVFKEIVNEYGELLDKSVEKRFYKVDFDISQELQTLSDKLGFLKASPRDVIEVHTNVLKLITADMKQQRTKVYHSEARLLLLEIMGNLVTYYRAYALGK